jgi:hypothetical protein
LKTKSEIYTFEVFWAILILIVFTPSPQIKTLFNKKEENVRENFHPLSFIPE